MKIETVSEILREASREHKGAIFSFEGGATLVLSTGGEPLSLDDIARVELKGAYLMADTERGDRFFAETETIVAVRVQRRQNEAGFAADR